MACRIWKWHDNDTYFHHHFYLKNTNLTVHYITGTYFFNQRGYSAVCATTLKGLGQLRISKFFVFPHPMGKKLWPTLIYQFEHLLHWSGTPYYSAAQFFAIIMRACMHQGIVFLVSFLFFLKWDNYSIIVSSSFI